MTGLKRLPWDVLAIALLAAALRLAWLDVKPPHFDEGVNGWFADRLRETGVFAYNPENYHGPWHFYAVFLAQSLLGRNLWALRLPAVLAGVATIPALFLFARWCGRPAVRWAALAFAVSPACVFYNRYSIHEPWFVLACVVFTWGVLALWLDRDRPGLWVAVLGLTGMILNKETYVIHAGSLGLAALVFAAWGRWSPVVPPAVRAPARQWTARDAWLAGVTAVVLLVVFYSGFLLNPEGLAGPFQAMVEWTKTGAAGAGHDKAGHELLPFVNYYWLALLARYEWPALAGLVWSVRYAWPAPAAPRLLAIMAAGILLAYSLVPYKTPWCIASIVWPWFLFFGLAADRRRWTRLVAGVLLAASLALALRLNFFRYENDAEPYVYVQTCSSVRTLTEPLLQAARRDPTVYHTAGAIHLESYYPLPWMLGDFTRIGYYYEPEIVDPLPEAEFHVIETERADKLRAALGEGYEERRFLLRSGVKECSVFFSRTLLEKLAAPAAPARRGEP